MMKKQLSFLLCLLLVTGCTGIVPVSTAATAQSESSALPELIPLRVTAFPYLSFAPLYIAEAEGLFAQQGIDVEFVRFQGNAESLPALLQGELDVDAIFTVGLLNVIASGESVRVVANKGMLIQNGCPADGFVVRTELATQMAALTAEEVGALTFGVDPTWLDSYLLQQVLAGHGLDLSDVTTEYIANPAARVEALRQGLLDVAFMSEPWLTRAQEEGAAVLWQPAADIIPGYSLGVLNFGPSLLERDDDLGVRFLHAYLQGIARYNAGKTARNLAILQEATQLDVDLLEQICWPAFPANGQIDATAIRDYSVWATERGLADRPLTVEEFWAPDLLIEAMESIE